MLLIQLSFYYLVILIQYLFWFCSLYYSFNLQYLIKQRTNELIV